MQEQMRENINFEIIIGWRFYDFDKLTNQANGKNVNSIQLKYLSTW